MQNPHNSQADFRDFPLADADSCVKCGLCLPHCPTYSVTGLEGDSPRGRIALMQGLAQGHLEPEGSALTHLDGCLDCRACESVCPANVPYGRLIDGIRDGLRRSGHQPGLRWKLLAYFRATPIRINVLGSLLRTFDATRLRRILGAFPVPGMKRSMALAGPASMWPRPGVYSADTTRGDVGLFLGCIARPLDARIAHATITLLNALGFNVHLPASQGCCGAMDQHAGLPQRSAGQLARNQQAFDGVSTVLTTASGCGIHLAEHSTLTIRNAADFILDEFRRHPIKLDSRNEHILVHSPCTLRQMKADAAVPALMRLLPGATVSELPHAHCCGAAGSYLFEQPDMSETLGDRTWKATSSCKADVLVTSNIGCALQLRYARDKQSDSLPVRHPLELLAERLPAD